jgi:hypothetical protein
VCLTLPDHDLWVNLSPYESTRIIADNLGQTQTGADLLAMDYLLKQTTAAFMSPETATGRQFWDHVHQRLYNEFHLTELPAEAMNKVWIIPDSASIEEHRHGVDILSTRLSVMLEDDYLHRFQSESAVHPAAHQPVRTLTAEVMRTVVVPELELAVNSDPAFGRLRQIFNAYVLAMWF